MNTKLTLTLDPEVIQQAKQYAKSQGTSVSKLVENYFSGLQKHSKDQKLNLTGVVEDLAGAIKHTGINDINSEIVGYLEEKYNS